MPCKCSQGKSCSCSRRKKKKCKKNSFALNKEEINNFRVRLANLSRNAKWHLIPDDLDEDMDLSAPSSKHPAPSSWWPTAAYPKGGLTWGKDDDGAGIPRRMSTKWQCDTRRYTWLDLTCTWHENMRNSLANGHHTACCCFSTMACQNARRQRYCFEWPGKRRKMALKCHHCHHATRKRIKKKKEKQWRSGKIEKGSRIAKK